MAFKVEVDLQRCRGHGQCEEAAPEVFRVNDNASVELLTDTPGDHVRAAVEEAVWRCPVEAIRARDLE